MTKTLWLAVLALGVVAVLLALPWLGRKLGLLCGQVGWVDNKPYQCRAHRWHTGPHVSAWHTASTLGEQERVKWFDGEFGAASSRETRAAPPPTHPNCRCEPWVCKGDA